MVKRGLWVVAAWGWLVQLAWGGTWPVLEEHCIDCHAGPEAEALFEIDSLGDSPSEANLSRWIQVADRLQSAEMPPPDASSMTPEERREAVGRIWRELETYRQSLPAEPAAVPRRMNNREFRNAVRDVLMIKDIGTHQPADDLVADTLKDGFDTDGQSLGFSGFHLERYIDALRRILDATLLDARPPAPRRYEIEPTGILAAHLSQNTTRPERRGTPEGFDFLDPKQAAYFEDFPTVPHTGWYRIVIRCTGKDRGLYPSAETGIYDGDPIRLAVHMGDRRRVFDLPDERPIDIELNEWLATGTRLRLYYPTDGLTLRGNGNFKFQNSITGEFLQKHDPELFQAVLDRRPRARNGELRKPMDWHNWVDYWRGPRPRVFAATVEGPMVPSWPPERQVRLIGRDPDPARAAEVLQPIAERAWRRQVPAEELAPVVELVQSKASELGAVEAYKEGILAILVSPQFLFVHRPDLSPSERFAEKLGLLLSSSIPDARLQAAVASGELNDAQSIARELERRIERGEADEFLKQFPYAWLRLSDINFMAPDPDQYRFYHRKRLSEDMVGEVLALFEHAVRNNIELPELLAADYSFVNADLARLYGLEDVPQDSRFRQYHFHDGRRGGLLGTGAFLTITADTLTTSPIHRAVYVMRNFLGIEPTPPPGDVQIAEPDVRQARTIREVLDLHRTESICASCHQRIDPYGYAFENFDPSGAWRDVYSEPAPTTAGVDGAEVSGKGRTKVVSIPIDASARLPDGAEYGDVVEFRHALVNDANRRRFVRCFITKLLTYANGQPPREVDAVEIERLVARAAEYDYRLLDTMALVIDSPLFRD